MPRKRRNSKNYSERMNAWFFKQVMDKYDEASDEVGRVYWNPPEKTQESLDKLKDKVSSISGKLMWAARNVDDPDGEEAVEQSMEKIEELEHDLEQLIDSGEAYDEDDATEEWQNTVENYLDQISDAIDNDKSNFKDEHAQMKSNRR